MSNSIAKQIARELRSGNRLVCGNCNGTGYVSDSEHEALPKTTKKCTFCKGAGSHKAVEPKAELRRFWLLYVDGWFCSVSCSEAQAQAASDVNKENGVCYTKELILTFEELKAKCVGAADASQLAWAWNAAKVVPAKVPVFAGEEK